MSWYREWQPYVSVAQRKAKATRYASDLAKREKRTLAPIQIEGRKIAKTFWGTAWCENLERYSDYSNRLPRGSSYVRNGSVIDLQVEKGTINALVSGSDIYTIEITISTLPSDVWKKIQKDCSQSIDSLLDLMQGKFDRGVMERLTEKEGGLFPKPKEIKFSCSCPDIAGMCKHIAATMYGVGHRLDSSPELLFQLRGVDHLELIGAALSAANLGASFNADRDQSLEGSDLGELFGIDLDVAGTASPVRAKSVRNATKKKRTKKQSPNASDTAKKRKSAREAIVQTEGVATRAALAKKTAKQMPAVLLKKIKKPLPVKSISPIKAKTNPVKKKPVVRRKPSIAIKTELRPAKKTSASQTKPLPKKKVKKVFKAILPVSSKRVILPK